MRGLATMRVLLSIAPTGLAVGFGHGDRPTAALRGFTPRAGRPCVWVPGSRKARCAGRAGFGEVRPLRPKDVPDQYQNRLYAANYPKGKQKARYRSEDLPFPAKHAKPASPDPYQRSSRHSPHSAVAGVNLRNLLEPSGGRRAYSSVKHGSAGADGARTREGGASGAGLSVAHTRAWGSPCPRDPHARRRPATLERHSASGRERP